MLAEQSLKEGDLGQTLLELQEAVRSNPADAKRRIFLFQLLAITGDWKRAVTQLKVIADLDASALPMVHTYHEAVRCERLREQVFAGASTPLVFGDPERWVALLIEALRPAAEGRSERAQTLRDEAFELAPATAGSINGEAFEWIADADVRLGPVLETVINGGYYWVPFDRIREIRIEPPADLRDLVWTPAQFVWSNGGASVGLIPTRYPGSASSEDAQIRLARKTEWLEPAAGIYYGLGQRLLATDGGEYPLLDTRVLVLETTAQEAPAATAGADATPKG